MTPLLKQIHWRTLQALLSVSQTWEDQELLKEVFAYNTENGPVPQSVADSINPSLSMTAAQKRFVFHCEICKDAWPLMHARESDGQIICQTCLFVWQNYDLQALNQEINAIQHGNSILPSPTPFIARREFLTSIQHS